MTEALMSDALAAGRIAEPPGSWVPRGGFWRWWFRLWGWAFVVYTGLIVLSTIQNAVDITHAGLPVMWPLLLTNRVLEEYSCALFVPPLFLLVRRFPLDRTHWRRSVPILLGATVSFVAVKYALMQPVFRMFFPEHVSPIGTAIATNLLAVMLDFWLVIAVAQALDFYRQVQERERAALELRERLTHAQLDALRSQLHPHFLFNTLNGAVTLLHRDPAAADRMLTQLSDLLRATLGQSGAQEIPLAEELALLDQYLAIMYVRLGDRLQVDMDVDPAARAVLVPPFLLQPLVENALEHGLAARPGPGRLAIRVQRDGGRLRIAVTDDGPGVAGGMVVAGIGLANTRARLAQLYGADHALALEPAGPGGGTRVTVSLPWREAPRAAPEEIGEG